MPIEEFDVFLCHNSADKPAVREIYQRLVDAGLKPWLDEEHLVPGRPWQRELENQIKNIKTAAVFVGQSGMGPWQELEQEAFLRQFVKRDCPVIPVILADCEANPEIPALLEGNTWVDFRDPEKQNRDPFDKLIWGITQQKPENPG